MPIAARNKQGIRRAQQAQTTHPSINNREAEDLPSSLESCNSPVHSNSSDFKPQQIILDPVRGSSEGSQVVGVPVERQYAIM